ncbi:MAG TPA: type II toxin-antitoxin system VapC family toxin [Bryobacteraceae bacterium]|nr:type II toxin-antitoxin system VapC family toxin [Bryobacteraceae bacterium]
MPASGRFLLDTNIVIAVLAGDEAVLANLDLASEVFVPVIVLGELFFGAAKSGRPLENAAKVNRFAAGNSILNCDLPVAREYGRLKQDLREKGKPLPENDLWIAAIANCYQLIVATRDRHFGEIDGLVTAAW